MACEHARKMRAVLRVLLPLLAKEREGSRAALSHVDSQERLIPSRPQLYQAGPRGRKKQNLKYWGRAILSRSKPLSLTKSSTAEAEKDEGRRRRKEYGNATRCRALRLTWSTALANTRQQNHPQRARVKAAQSSQRVLAGKSGISVQTAKKRSWPLLD